MTKYLYLGVILFSLVGLMLADWRHGLAIFSRNRRRAVVILLLGLVFFLAWDVSGIVTGTFLTKPEHVSGWYIITPNMPVEEPLFLLLLVYQTLIFWSIKWPRFTR